MLFLNNFFSVIVWPGLQCIIGGSHLHFWEMLGFVYTYLPYTDKMEVCLYRFYKCAIVTDEDQSQIFYM